MEPQIYNFNYSEDYRGKVFYNNEADLTKIVRTYSVENINLKTVRAWHGHKFEEKWVNVEVGKFLICIVKVDNFSKPNIKNKIYEFEVAPSSGIIHIPSGFANGAMNLTLENRIRYYSTSTINESSQDDYRFEPQYWDPWSKYKPNLYE